MPGSEIGSKQILDGRLGMTPVKGSSADGVKVFDSGGTVALAEDLYATSINVSNNTKLDSAGFRIFCDGLFEIEPGSEWQHIGGDAVGTTPGAAASAGDSIGDGLGAGGTAGLGVGTAPFGPGAAGGAGESPNKGMGGSGGGGGAPSGAGTPGSGGTATEYRTHHYNPGLPQYLDSGSYKPTGGGAGGGGGPSGDGGPTPPFDDGGDGGAGGAGGGQLIAYVGIFKNNGVVNVGGGIGSAGSASAGAGTPGAGGGGGGAGSVYVVANVIEVQGVVTLTGGAGGPPGAGVPPAGTGSTGAAGSGVFIEVSTGITTIL